MSKSLMAWHMLMQMDAQGNVTPAPNGGETAADLAPVTVLEPAAEYVVCEGTAYGPFWSYSDAQRWRNKHFLRAGIYHGSTDEVKACKTFVNPAETKNGLTPITTPAQPATARKLTAAMRRVLQAVADGKATLIVAPGSVWLRYLDGSIHMVRKDTWNRISQGHPAFVMSTGNPYDSEHVYWFVYTLTDAGRAALAARESEAGKE